MAWEEKADVRGTLDPRLLGRGDEDQRSRGLLKVLCLYCAISRGDFLTEKGRASHKFSLNVIGPTRVVWELGSWSCCAWRTECETWDRDKPHAAPGLVWITSGVWAVPLEVVLRGLFMSGLVSGVEGFPLTGLCPRCPACHQIALSSA